MSMSVSEVATIPKLRGPTNHQSDSWLSAAVLGALLRPGERRQLRELAEDPRRLADFGLTRDQALHEAGKPFWR